MIGSSHKPRTSKETGILIAVEGLDGSGKSTQIYLVKRWLELEGYKVFFTEWNSSPLVKSATKRGKKKTMLSPSTFALIHATDLADRYESQIQPLLQAGYIVLADRYVFTAFARDTVRGCDREWIRKLYGFARLPDLTFFFDVPLETALSRILDGRPQLKYYEAGLDIGLSTDPYESFRLFQAKIREEYLVLAKEFKFLTVNASRLPDVQQLEVRAMIRKMIDLPRYQWSKRKQPENGSTVSARPAFNQTS
ncbi:MAG: dTMP kinase [bacterium]|nr:dTMP kinase [bacterium]